jgi:thiamine-monophosphate kinase
MNEFELIARLRPLLTGNASVVVGAGDDCAVLASPGPGRELLFKTDCVVEGVHFTPETAPDRIGRKALARVLSDVAAMGGTPTAAVITLGLPTGFDSDRVEAIYRGMAELARTHEVALVGGETSRTPGAFSLGVALVGWVPAGRAVLRSGARVGDALFVTGELGGSIEGHHLDFEPRLEEGRWLTENFSVHAMMDLSDGLAGDLPHLLAASGVPGAVLHRDALPIRRAALLRARLGDTAKPAVAAALTDGEDFELLLAVAPADAVRLLDRWRERFPSTRISCIGRLTNQPGVFLREERGLTPIPGTGYRHFA